MDLSRHISVFNPTAVKHDIHIIGVGATGSFVAMMLARMGVPVINIYDFDDVEITDDEEDGVIAIDDFSLKEVGSEIELLPIGAIMMTLECGLRFLTDYIEGDTYFRISRPSHNLDRCRTQFALVADMEKKLEEMRITQ